MAASSVVVAVKTLLSVLACVVAAVIAYAIAMDGFYSCLDPHARWMQLALTDFIIILGIISAWFVYKESSWIMGAVFMVLLLCLGSVVTCGYIVLQFYKLSPEESLKDPFYFVLVRHQKGDVTRQTRGPSVVTARIIFAVLCCLMLGMLIYAVVFDGSPFHAEVLTPCMIATLTDTYVHVVVLSIWIAYKEASLISAILWIVLLVCFGSITTCAYIVRQLFYLSPQQSVSQIIFCRSNRDLQSSDPLLMAHPDV